ncbi:transcriptional regulator [Serratia marcescens]|uniref:helix-turn-helix domain-containing protein n=1 Tax=Serratia marcescens TaxID=615 RepID=UPI0010376274|nr:transcriptional regulator [Serratia marcescens]TBU68463.1 transcriptional regulator [Serratia marcescens]
MTLSEKIKAIRVAEGLSKAEFCRITEIPASTMEKYEMGKFEPGGAALTKITQNSRFEKYTMWLMTGKTMPEVGQISPALSPDGQNGTPNHQNGRKAG